MRLLKTTYAKIILFIFLYLISTSAIAQEDKSKEATDLINKANEFITVYPDSALVLFQKAEQIAIDIDNKTILALAYRRMGVAYHYAGDYKKGQEANFKSLEIRQNYDIESNDSLQAVEIANLYYNIAINYQYLGELATSIEYIQKLEPIYTKLEDYPSLSFKCYSFIAKIYYGLGDLPKAQLYTYKELEVSEKIFDTIGITYAKDFLAVIKQDQGNYDEALALQKETLELREAFNDSIFISYSFNNIGSTYLKMEEYEEALGYFNKSLKIKLSLGDISKIAATYNNLGVTYQKMENYQLSKENYTTSYEFCTDRNDFYGICIACVNLGVINGLLEQNIKAEKFLTEAYDLAIKYGYKQLIIESTGFLAEFYEKEKRFKDAFYMLTKNVLYVDSVENDDVIKELTRLEVEYDFNKKHVEDSISNYHKLINQNIIHEEELKRKEQMIIIIAILFIFIIFVIFILFKSYQLRKVHQENQLKQKALEIEKNLLRSQMNPHFIFNAMNSIQSFIATNDSYSAERYLSKFAKLIRLILENTLQQTIPLSDELQSLRLYLELEQVRFDKKFDFEINLAEEVEDELIYVPPMLMQPFVENAIIHGIMHKKGNGLIKISISESELPNTLKCEISDNGIGRAEAAELKKIHGKKHKSIGMQLTRERLESLNHETQPNMSFKIVDLLDIDDKPLGTKVELFIPYYDNLI